MKALAVLAVLTTFLLCTSRAAPATSSICSTTPISPSGPCAYCLEPVDTSLEDGGLAALNGVLLRSLNDLDNFCDIIYGHVCALRFIGDDIGPVSPDVDVHNDQINGELLTFLQQLHQAADSTCATEEVASNSTLLGVCNTIKDKLRAYIQATRAYLENQKCGCPDHEQCYYQPSDEVPDDSRTRSLTELLEDVYAHVLLTINIIRKIKYSITD